MASSYEDKQNYNFNKIDGQNCDKKNDNKDLSHQQKAKTGPEDASHILFRSSSDLPDDITIIEKKQNNTNTRLKLPVSTNANKYSSQDSSNRNNKTNTSSARRLGTKVSAIATIFQSLTPNSSSLKTQSLIKGTNGKLISASTPSLLNGNSQQRAISGNNMQTNNNTSQTKLSNVQQQSRLQTSRSIIASHSSTLSLSSSPSSTTTTNTVIRRRPAAPTLSQLTSSSLSLSNRSTVNNQSIESPQGSKSQNEKDKTKKTFSHPSAIKSSASSSSISSSASSNSISSGQSSASGRSTTINATSATSNSQQKSKMNSSPSKSSSSSLRSNSPQVRNSSNRISANQVTTSPTKFRSNPPTTQRVSLATTNSSTRLSTSNDSDSMRTTPTKDICRGTSRRSPSIDRNGLSNSNNSTSTSGRGLNRTASRVSRFNSAKAVFERLSNTDSSKLASSATAAGSSSSTFKAGSKTYGPSTIRGRYLPSRSSGANISNINNTTDSMTTISSSSSTNNKLPSRSTSSPSSTKSIGPSILAPSRLPSAHSTSSAVGEGCGFDPRGNTLNSNSNGLSSATTTYETTTLEKTSVPSALSARSTSHPRPLPRIAIASSGLSTDMLTTRNVVTNSKLTVEDGSTDSRYSAPNSAELTQQNQQTETRSTALCSSTNSMQPPTKDLIDKIVLKIADDAQQDFSTMGGFENDIQDLNSCDISGIPDTLDFDKCFQDVEMMTEEEAQKLLSRKSRSTSAQNFRESLATTDNNSLKDQKDIEKSNSYNDTTTATGDFTVPISNSSGISYSSSTSTTTTTTAAATFATRTQSKTNTTGLLNYDRQVVVGNSTSLADNREKQEESDVNDEEKLQQYKNEDKAGLPPSQSTVQTAKMWVNERERQQQQTLRPSTQNKKYDTLNDANNNCSKNDIVGISSTASTSVVARTSTHINDTLANSTYSITASPNLERHSQKSKSRLSLSSALNGSSTKNLMHQSEIPSDDSADNKKTDAEAEINPLVASISGPGGLTECGSVIVDNVEYHILPDGHYYTEVSGLPPTDDEDDENFSKCDINSRIDRLGHTNNTCFENDSHSNKPQSFSSQKHKAVKFSHDPIRIFSTHAVEDYDRRNDDVDPVTASAEYELEKLMEQEGGVLCEQGDDQDDQMQQHHHLQNGNNIESSEESSVSYALRECVNGYGQQSGDCQQQQHDPRCIIDGDANERRIDYLEQEAKLKQILEQNMRDLQGQYYEVVKDLNNAKSDHESQVRSMQETIDANKKELDNHEKCSQALKDESDQYFAQLNALKDSSQLLEKKYHRAKKIIKEMQQREQSFSRREQIYQQKIGEIENELSAFVDSLTSKLEKIELDRANQLNIAAHRLSIPSQPNQHTNMNAPFEAQACLKAVLEDYNQKPGNPEIRQRVLNILKQHVIVPDANDQKIESSHGTMIATSKIGVEPTIKHQQSSSSILLMQDHPDDSMNHSTIVASDEQNQYLDHEAISQSYEPSSLNFFSGNLGQDLDNQINKDNQIDLSQHVTANQHPTKYSVGQRMSSAPLINSKSISKNQHNQHQFVSSSSTPQQSSVPSMVPGNRLSHPPIANSHLSQHQPSPPDSVNSYTSSASLNSLPYGGIGPSTSSLIISDTSATTVGAAATNSKSQLSQQANLPMSSASSSNFTPVSNIQVPYQTVEWHEKPVSEWTTTQVSTWLLALGLDQYISKFEDRNVNGQSLINLDSTVLKGLGVLNSNDRNLLKKKIREMRAEIEKEKKILEKKQRESQKEKLKQKEKSLKNLGNNKENTGGKPTWKRGLLS